MRDNVTLLAGAEQVDAAPWPPFDPRAVDFLAELSAEVLRGPDTRRQEASAAFGFWCRRARLEALAARHASPLPRLGRGLAFHLAPANVPALFAYTLAIGLLAGNANVVRLSSRRVEGEAPLLAALRRVLERPEHATVRAMPMPPHAVELCFPDRWSLAVFSQRAFSALTPEERGALAHRFYNDTYQMDQNACSSPQLVLWLEDGGDPACRGRWWEAVAAEAAERYPFGPFQAARKLERLCLCAMTMEEPAVAAVERYQGNLLYVARLAGLSGNLPSLAGGFGLFFEAALPSLEALAPLLPPKAQTLVCGGLEPSETAALLARAGARGVDRVVPLGQALEMDTVWDGRDLIAALSRIIG